MVCHWRAKKKKCLFIFPCALRLHKADFEFSGDRFNGEKQFFHPLLSCVFIWRLSTDAEVAGWILRPLQSTCQCKLKHNLPNCQIHVTKLWMLLQLDLRVTFPPLFLRLLASSTPYGRSAVTRRTWQPFASTPSTPSWIPGSSSSVASRSWNTSAPCWAAGSAEEPWRRRRNAACLCLLTATCSAPLRTGRSSRPASTPTYLRDPSHAPKFWGL